MRPQAHYSEHAHRPPQEQQQQQQQCRAGHPAAETRAPSGRSAGVAGAEPAAVHPSEQEVVPC
ncbi:hypothetical protein [Actinomyces radicidentis]|uniref:hypothetical protein n=1 Tax=Actinomyces radicidentis TaxID=111015 RepID=UPI0026E0985D|nr:hypothetical protein [Actinomyces radicidentis]